MKQRNDAIIIAGVSILAAVMRFVFLPSWVNFGMDQEYQALISDNITHGWHLPLIGVNASDTGIYLGPWFSYLAAVFHFIFSGNPIGSALVASATGVVVAVLIYVLGKQMVGSRAAVIAAVVYAGSFLISFYDREFWNPSPVPLISLLIGYCCYRLKKGQAAMLIWLSILVGLVFSVHLSLLIFIPYVVFSIWKQRKSYSRKQIAVAIGMFGILLAPLLMFEARHDFLNTRAALLLFSGNQHAAVRSTLVDRSSLLFQTFGRLLWVPGTVDLFAFSGQCREGASLRGFSVPIGLFMIYLCCLFFWKKGKEHPLIVYLLLATVVFILLYPRSLSEYYFLYLFPWLALLIGVMLTHVGWNKRPWSVVVWIVGGIFIAGNLWTLFHATYSYSYRDKMKAVAFAKPYLSDYPYVLEAVGECPRFGGWRYLFAHGTGRAPTHSYLDSYFSWLYREQPGVEPVQRLVLLSLIDARLPLAVKQEWRKKEQTLSGILSPVAQQQFGDITVRILNE